MVSTIPEPASVSRLRRSRSLRRLGISAFALVVILGISNRLGPLEERVSASARDYELVVSYPIITRAGLPVSWLVEVERAGGWIDPVVVSVTHSYFEIFDFHGMTPEPSSTRVEDDLLILEFDPPEGERLTVRFDGRVEPGIQASREATTAIHAYAGEIAEVRYRTWVAP